MVNTWAANGDKLPQWQQMTSATQRMCYGNQSLGTLAGMRFSDRRTLEKKKQKEVVEVWK